MAYIQPNYMYPQYGYQNQYLQQAQPNIIQQQFPTIYGKIVDGIDVVKSIDVPLGATYVMPQASGNYIYSKGWNSDGTTYVKEYKLVEQSQVKENFKIDGELSNKLDNISCQINSLVKKIDKMNSQPLVSMKKHKTEVEDDE